MQASQNYSLYDCRASLKDRAVLWLRVMMSCEARRACEAISFMYTSCVEGQLYMYFEAEV